MAAKYSDDEIEALVREPKPLPEGFEARISLHDKRGHKESELDVRGANGNVFRIIARQNAINRLDFSLILAVLAADTTQVFRLRRYNGKSHEHTNRLERESFYDFHVHYATERYQESGTREDAYAEVTDGYDDLPGAIDCLIKECGFTYPPGHQRSLFEVQDES